MKIIHDYPPMIDEIDAAFNIRGQTIIFAWGDTIYSPTGWNPPPELHAHEEVHGQRQGDDIEGWWKKYIADPEFRLEEEIIAHRAEYQHFAKRNDRPARRRALRRIAKRLCSSLYGKVITFKKARERLLEGA